MSVLSLRHVLLATDFSAACARARTFAVDLVRRAGARLTVLHVLPPIGYPYWIPRIDAVRSGVARALDAHVDALRDGLVEARGVLRDGAPSIEIIDAARELEVDVVVMGTHGRTGLRHALLGSVAEKVVRASTVPVITVTSWRFEDVRDAASRLAPMLRVPPRAVIVGVGRSGALLAAQLGVTKATTADVLLTAPLLTHERVSGFVAEEGTQLLRGRAAMDVESVPGSARDTVLGEASDLRDGCPRVAVTGRPVIVVAERADVLALELAVDVTRKAGASEVRIAVGVADEPSLVAVKALADEAIAVEIAASTDEVACAYRDARPPSIGAIRAQLLATRAREAASTLSGAA